MTTPPRPAGLPAEAIWSPSDREWALLPQDAEGRPHGLATYWRPDGTLVNHCEMVHGVPHGWFKRYHENGEVSRAGHFADGKLHGLDTFYRSTGETTEVAFASPNMPASAWRYELEMVHGRVTTARWYDRDGAQITDTGEPVPERPAGVPASAVFLSRSACWLAGETDAAGHRHGLWRTWDRGGAPVGERELEHGVEIAARRFACAEDAEAAAALREGRGADALAAARRWHGRAELSADRILAAELLARCLPEGDERMAALREAADQPGVAWVFTDEGKRCYQAQMSALDALARHALEAGRLEDAVALCDRAIAIEHHFGPCAARAAKVRALRRLGRDDEAFAVARQILAADPEAPGLEDVRDDPRFAAWLSSIRTDGMTLEGAWEVLGRRGERLEAIAAPILAPAPGTPRAVPLDDDTDEDDEADDRDQRSGAAAAAAAARAPGLDAPWPIREVLGARLSPELDRWLSLAPQLRSVYRGHFVAGGASTIAAAVAARDGKWVARLEGLFLPVSVVLVEDEIIRHAAWVGGDHGASYVFGTHQDEPGFWPSQPAIAGFLAWMIMKDTSFEHVLLPAATKARWQRALALLREVPPEAEPHLSIPALYPRTGWIVYHLLGIRLEHELADAPGIDAWERERAPTAEWPHLQAYWLCHHLVFDNREELVGLLERAERRHPAVGELARLAEDALAGRAIAAPWWDETKVRGLRARALDTGHERVMTDAARARLRAALAGRDAAKAAADQAREALLASGDPRAKRVFEVWPMLEDIAGRVSQFEEQMLDRVFEDQDARMDYFMRQKNGHVSLLLRVLVPWLADIDGSFEAFFEATARRGAELDEDHASVIPGALVGLGGAISDFAAFRARVAALIDEARIGRRRRMELAIVAAARIEQPAARAFLIGEAERYGEQLAAGAWQVDTVAYSLFRLLELAPDEGGRILGETLASTPSFSGANWRPAILLIEEAGRRRVSGAAAGILAAIDRRLGRDDDGGRTAVTRAYAACSGPAGAAELATRLTGAKSDEVRCALLSALIDLDPTEARWHGDARATLERLLAARLGAAQSGAAISLLQTVAPTEGAGYGDLARRLLARVAEDKYVKAPAKAWLAEHAPKLA